MPTVLQPNNLVIDSEAATLDYLIYVAVRPRVPFERGARVNIADRSALPANVGLHNVGVVVECPLEGSICWILTLTTDGQTLVIAIPKAHLVAR